MASREKVCRNCKRFVRGSVCPVCSQSSFSRSWKGIVYINDPSGSEIAKSMDLKVPGKYTVWVK